MRQAIVLGAGMVGIGTALHLQQRGWAVTVVDRRGPGQETSYGNAGIIQSEAVSPHAMPRGVRRLLAMATGQTNDVHYHPGALPDHAEPLARYWWHSEPDRHRRISDAYARLIAAATAEHGALMAGCAANGRPVDGLVRREGFRAIFRDPADFDEAVAEVEHHRQRWGVRYATLTPAELARAEPALTQSGVAAIHGAIHWLDPWTLSDPGALVAAYAQSFVKAGGRLVQGDAATLTAGPGDGWSVTTDDGPVEADAAVVALGPWSPALLQPLGYRFPMVRKRGYHQHYSGGGLSLPLLDADFGCVLAPMARGLRITTGAQLTHADAPADPVQLARAEAAARALLDLGDPVNPTPWFGTRPCMPDMLPVIGQAPRHPGLWLHFGHGHQGLTMGPASGRLLAELMSGERPFTDPDAFRPERR
ncbi:NAD(P)/FAD-dependent oxidoreductase [Azospirillum griseum]|uniref:FAD-binding oxidoreductase n=1 Tax=Azospirillum griseum TaxID=2496639 RepID=A0A431VJF7_9PROT|nr:FAD-binding oxidoreductase [Azospirillum griseum]RTR21913.1 FAD-binding oxidoreductase [Azospirillum griseum]